jgi:hypothetical protein
MFYEILEYINKKVKEIFNYLKSKHSEYLLGYDIYKEL